ncbi:MAG: SIMPL domain-containing protein [Saprospiraceae bacterium]|nr:SIMPL domain-containing protein [Saprospiraceae bacterium]
MTMRILPLLVMLVLSFTALSQTMGNANQQVYNTSTAANVHNQNPVSNNTNNNKRVELPINLYHSNVNLQAEILYNAKPSTYLAIFATTQEGEKAEDVDRNMNQRIETFKRGLTEAGISSSQVFVDFISLMPKYEMQVEKKRFSKTANEVPIGFQLKKNIHISFTDGKVLDKIISAATAAEIYDLAKVEVSMSDSKKALAECREEAMKIIKEKTKVFADLGIKTTPLSIGDNFETYYPSENYESYVAAAYDYSQVQSQQQFKVGKIAVKYANKDRTVFYSRLPYDQFDTVINPDFIEPPIQIHYKLMVQYQIENIELKTKRDADEERNRQHNEVVRKDELRIRELQAQNPPKTCCDKN